MARRRRDANAVFLNVPFDASYERQFIALIASIVAIGRTPHCVLEVADHGIGRLARIVDLMRTCALSIHDLSRVGTPARFNMPFELGLACALYHVDRGHAFIVMEREHYRIQRTLSDINGYDPHIHGGTTTGVVTRVLDALRPTRGGPEISSVLRLSRKLNVVAHELKRPPDRTVYTRSVFLDLVEAAIELSAQAGFIQR